MMQRPLLILVAILLLPVTACAADDYSDDAEKPDESVVEAIPYTSSWSAEPHIDLFDRGSELVRAAIEGGRHASFYGVYESYPGYVEALGYPDFSIADITGIVSKGNPGRGPISPSTYWYHIADITVTAEEITAEVCDDRTLAVPSEARGRHGHAWVVTLQNTTDSPGLPGLPDLDPQSADPAVHRVPDWNVYGSWKITRLRTGGQNPRENIPHPACTQWWLSRHPDTVKVFDNYTYTPVGDVAAVPVAPQFPEWIGPSQPR